MCGVQTLEIKFFPRGSPETQFYAQLGHRKVLEAPKVEPIMFKIGFDSIRSRFEFAHYWAKVTFRPDANLSRLAGLDRFLRELTQPLTINAKRQIASYYATCPDASDA